jgi:hypothetical protein
MLEEALGWMVHLCHVGQVTFATAVGHHGVPSKRVEQLGITLNVLT